jgi:hypothetical protein
MIKRLCYKTEQIGSYKKGITKTFDLLPLAFNEFKGKGAKVTNCNLKVDDTWWNRKSAVC